MFVTEKSKRNGPFSYRVRYRRKRTKVAVSDRSSTSTLLLTYGRKSSRFPPTRSEITVTEVCRANDVVRCYRTEFGVAEPLRKRVSSLNRSQRGHTGTRSCPLVELRGDESTTVVRERGSHRCFCTGECDGFRDAADLVIVGRDGEAFDLGSPPVHNSRECGAAPRRLVNATFNSVFADYRPRTPLENK